MLRPLLPNPFSISTQFRRLATQGAAFGATSTPCLVPRAAAAGGRGGGGRVSDVLAIVGPINLLLPFSEARLYVRLLRRCIRSRDAAMGPIVHAQVIKRGLLGADLLFSNVLLDMYAKGGELDGCRNLFDEMPDRDVVSWCTVISGHAARGLCAEAIGVFKQMLASGLRPNRFVISSVLTACAGSGVLELGLLVHGLVFKSGLGIDRFVEVGFVNMYAKCGHVGDAVKSFNEIPVKCSVAWNAMISGYIENGCFIEGAELCREMRQVGMLMDVVTLRIVAGVAAVLELLEFCRNIHVYALKVGLGMDNFIVAELIKLLGKVGKVDCMGKLFGAVKRPDASLYSLAISGYHSNGHRDEAVKLAKELLSSGLSVREGDLVNVLNLCLAKEEVKQVHARAMKTGCFSYINVGNALISMYSEFGEMVDAESIFQKMMSRDIISWTAIMAGFVWNLRFEKALGSFENLLKSEISLDQHCIATITNACAGLQDVDKGKQIHSLVLKLGLLFFDFVNASLVHMYAKCGCIEAACDLFFCSLFPQNLVLTNVMLSGYCCNFQPHEAHRLFCMQYRSGLVPDKFTYSTVLGACADTGAKEAGEQIHCCVVKSGFEYSDVIIGNAIINFYVKCGFISSACKFFYSMRGWNVNSYAMLMLGYIQNRCSGEALQLFSDMQRSGLRANPVTFARILRGCADLPAIDLGRQVHGSIIKMGLISDVYIEHALVGMYRKSGSTEALGTSQEMLIGDDLVCDSTSDVCSQDKERESTMKAIGLFTLEEATDHGKYADIRNLYVSAASRIYETPLPVCVAENDFKFDSILEVAMNYKSRKSMPLQNYVIPGYEANECGSTKLLKLVQENNASLDHIVLVVFSDGSHFKVKDATIENLKFAQRSQNILAFGMPP